MSWQLGRGSLSSKHRKERAWGIYMLKEDDIDGVIPEGLKLLSAIAGKNMWNK